MMQFIMRAAGKLAGVLVLVAILASAQAVPAGGNAPSAPSSTQNASAIADSIPAGFVLYEGQKDQFTIAIPQGWVARDRSQILQIKGGTPSPFSLTYFYLPPQTAPDEATPEAIRKLVMSINTGEVPSFFVQKKAAEEGMSCEGFSEKAQKSVFNIVAGDPMFSLRAIIVELPRPEPISLGGCKGIRVYGTGQSAAEETPRTIDMNAVSDGKILYLFVMGSAADNYKKNAETFKKSLATAKLTAGK